MNYGLLTLRSLHARIAAATGPDRELDAAIMGAFYVLDARYIGVRDYGSDEKVLSVVWVDAATDKWVSTCAREFTGSIDATVALLDRIIPNNDWQFCKHGGGHLIYGGGVEEPLDAMGKGATVALSMLEALFSALIAIKEREDANG